MLHEILLSLSGHPSPLLRSTISSHESHGRFRELLSPSEAALLSSLARLSDLHRELLAHTSIITASHRSMICRAVSAAIVSTHLAHFQAKVLTIERGVLQNDAGRVGAYGIVPLSGVVGELAEWNRPMEWLWDLVQFMWPLPESDDAESRERLRTERRESQCSGAALMDRLRDDLQTGYPDLERLAVDLVSVAETAWVRQLSTWMLYGRVPTFGTEDFFIQVEKSPKVGVNDDDGDFVVDDRLKPQFVTASTASSMLFVGRSLNHIRARDTALSSAGAESSMAHELDLLPAHLRYLSSLSYPISSSNLSAAVAAIRLSLSKNTLQQLLPLPKILKVLSILRDYLLLERGEFAIALINEADEQVRSRGRRQGLPRNGPSEQLGTVLVKEGEVSAVLTRTWAALSLFQHDDEDEEEVGGEEDLARDLLHLHLSKAPTATSPAATPTRGSNSPTKDYRLTNVSFHDLLLSTPVTLSLHVTSPLDLFLTTPDLAVYSAIHAYLLSIRRGHVRLTDLWKRTALRREHPTPLGPPYSNSPPGQEVVRTKRGRSNTRTRQMRQAWATAGAAVFLLTEVGEYFQGEVVKGSWDAFQAWLEMGGEDDKNDPKHDDDAEDPWTSAPAPAPTPASTHHKPHDPETLTHAHRTYLRALVHHLLLDDEPFTKTLRHFLQRADQLGTTVSRLQETWQALDLETDDGVIDSFSDVRRDERDILRALLDGAAEVQTLLGKLVKRLRALDAERAGRTGGGSSSRGGWGGGAEGAGGGDGADAFVPWRATGVDRLLMKLDFGTLVVLDEVFDEEEGG
ncbi:MAG: hypothetical protein M1838_002287 [Thelocarpon superellum]|nr:MAG: hypothetical protein M1838_002287 [Thelocarpon superellum]